MNKCLTGVKETLKRLNIKHDLFVLGGEFVRSGAVDAVVTELKQKGNVKLDGTALLLQLEGIEKELVIKRSDGTSLYTTRDLAYHRWKSNRCDRMIDAFGKDHELGSQQLTKALALLSVKAPSGKGRPQAHCHSHAGPTSERAGKDPGEELRNRKWTPMKNPAASRRVSIAI